MGDALSFGLLKKIVYLRESVIHSLRAAIVTGQMSPGQVYSAPALAARFGVSATPVREAMVDLAREGLVETVPNKGFRVTAVSDTELDEIAGLRRLIEPPTVQQVTPIIPDDDLPHLRELAQAIVDHAATGDLIAYAEADRRFHQAILEYSRNARLISTVNGLRAQTRLYGLAEMAEQGTLAASATEHLTLVGLIADRDAAGAGALMTRHIGRVREEWARPAP